DFAQGLEIERNPAFNAWLTAQRRRLRACHAALLEHLVRGASDDEAAAHLERWLELAPFDPRVHELFLRTLARRGRIREGEEPPAATSRLFEPEGLDVRAVREAWRAARAEAAHGDADRVQIVAPETAMIPAHDATPHASGDTPARRASIA